MKLAWHIVRKDLVRLRWVLALWGVVLIGGLVLTTIQSGLDAETYLPFYVAAKVVNSGLVPLIAFGLVMGLLHDDSVAEIDAFWITRPISGGALLVAKALAWLLLGLIPIVVALPFWLSHDYGWQQIALATQQTLRAHFIIAALALPFAVMSANGSKFVMNIIVGAGGILLLVLLFRLGNSPAEKSIPAGLLQSRAWLVAWLWIAAALTVTLNQFLRRRARQSWAVLTVAVVAGVVVAKGWPWKLESVLGDSASPAMVAETQPRRESPAFPVTINGEAKRVVVVAEVPLREGTVSSRAGMTLRLQTVFLDFTGELQISFSEATPNLSEEFRDLLPGAVAKSAPPEYYFIHNRSDGRAFAIKPSRFADELAVATLRFSHLSVRARPANSWVGSAPPQLATWLKDAVLVKVIADDAGPVQGATAAAHVPP